MIHGNPDPITGYSQGVVLPDVAKVEKLEEELGAAHEEHASAIEEAVEEAHSTVSGTAETAVEVAQDAAETVEEAVRDEAEAISETTGVDEDALYNRIMDRLQESGRLVAQVAEAPADEVAEVTPDIVPDAVVEVTQSAHIPGDEIHPRSEHPYYKRRRILGREW